MIGALVDDRITLILGHGAIKLIAIITLGTEIEIFLYQCYALTDELGLKIQSLGIKHHCTMHRNGEK